MKSKQTIKQTATLALVNSVMLAGVAHGQSTNAPAATGGSTNTPAAKLPDVLVKGQAEPGYNAATVSSPRYTEPLRDIPQTITVVPQSVIRDQGATTLRDVLRNVPGISIQAGEGGGGLPGDNLSIRGFNSRSDMFVDGVRDFGAYSRDPYNVEQVEVSKGPSSTTAGRGTAGGSINMVTKRPQQESFYGGTLGFGTDDHKRFTIDLNQSLADGDDNSSALRLNALWHDADVPGRDVVSENRWGINPSIGIGLGTPTRFIIDYQHMEQDNVPTYGIPWVPAGNLDPVLSNYINQAPPVDYANFYGLENYDFEDIRNDIITATVEHDFSDSLSLRNLSRYGDTYRRHAITAPRFADVDPVTPGAQTTTVVNRQLQQRELEHDILANVTDFTADFDTGKISHALVAGFEVSHEDQDNRNSAQATNQPQTDIYNPTPGDQPLGPMPGITGVANEAQALTLAPYIFDTVEFTEHWLLTGGVRYDHVESDYETGPASLERTDDLVSWRAGLIYKPRENGSIYAGYGNSFIPAIAAGNSGLALTPNDAALEPEETRSFEVGTKWDLLEERLSLTVALFRTEKTNARTAGVNPGDPPLVLDGEQVVQGVEFGFAGRLTEAWQVFGGYAYMDSEITESNSPEEVGAAFANTPDHSASLWTTYDLPWDLQVGFGVQYVGDRYNNQSGNASVRVAPDYWLFDALIAYRVSENVTLRLNAYNLADEDYIDRVGGGHFIPGAGRSAVLSASFDF